MPTVSFLVVNYFTACLVSELIASIHLNIKRCTYEILICDNSCDANEKEILHRLQNSRVKVFYPTENIGFVRASNFLSAQASYDILVLLNPDSILIDTSLEDLFYYIISKTDIGACGPMLINADGSYQVSFYRFFSFVTLCKEHLLFWVKHAYRYPIQPKEPFECDVIKGACLVIRKTVAQKVGLFDEAFIMYSEEVDLCYRLKKLGYHNWYYPQARIIHYGEQSSQRQESSEYTLYHYYRSKLIFFSKHWNSISRCAAYSVIFFSLIEKSLIFLILFKFRASRLHFRVWKLLLNNLKTIYPLHHNDMKR